MYDNSNIFPDSHGHRRRRAVAASPPWRRRRAVVAVPPSPRRRRNRRDAAAVARCGLKSPRDRRLVVAVAVGYAACHSRHTHFTSCTRTCIINVRCARNGRFSSPPRSIDRHARVAAAAALARSLDRAHAVWRWRWRWRWRSVTPRVHASRTLHGPCVTRARTCVIYVRRVCHHRFPSPPAHDRHARVAAALARSLARLIARARCGVGDGGGGGDGLRRA